MKFIGIDFGWRSQSSGLCCLKWIDGQLQLLDLDRKEVIADILTWIDQSVQPDEPAIIAVDAPTLIPNVSGSRFPDKLSHKYFGKYHAGCYPANKNLPFADRTINFGLDRTYAKIAKKLNLSNRQDAFSARGFANAQRLVEKNAKNRRVCVSPIRIRITRFCTRTHH